MDIKSLENNHPQEIISRIQTLIPQKLYEAMENSENLDIKTEIKANGSVSITFIERNTNRNLTNLQEWNDWVSKYKEAEARKEMFLPRPTAGINRLHARHRVEILSGKLNLSDVILMEVNLLIDNENPEILYVSNFDGVEGKGIGSDFYIKNLPNLCRQMGIRFIRGLNNGKNFGFFKEKLNRYTYDEVKPEYRRLFFPKVSGEGVGVEYNTVQFVFPEDIDKYIIGKQP